MEYRFDTRRKATQNSNHFIASVNHFATFDWKCVREWPFFHVCNAGFCLRIHLFLMRQSSKWTDEQIDASGESELHI